MDHSLGESVEQDSVEHSNIDQCAVSSHVTAPEVPENDGYQGISDYSQSLPINNGNNVEMNKSQSSSSALCQLASPFGTMPLGGEDDTCESQGGNKGIIIVELSEDITQSEIIEDNTDDESQNCLLKNMNMTYL